ncbi:hypothetical protein BVG16_31605 [Paenibacillus selenitireducens]|uniref:GerMN domain-containing protein n=1 Tax=Paenibacillus selenitireducens TaxID=1324314 RepID=A0A1T2WZ20_9BACL|nr:GerMN domain-containing protein [Paenibacillus selenitireducens]OPA72864.1 hypothetical protein BVG16_31605 [Paenibacillus selenitireducens]
MRKFTLLAGTFVLLLALATGCGQKTETNTNTQTGDTTEVQQPTEQTLKIQSYYTDDQILNLVPKEQEIKFVEEKDKYLTALKTLQKTDDPNQIALWEESEFLSAELKDGGALTVDVKVPAEAHLGASAEDLAVQALLKTAFQFDEVKSVDILVDGQSVDTMMGHVELEHPYTRN